MFGRARNFKGRLLAIPIISTLAGVGLFLYQTLISIVSVGIAAYNFGLQFSNIVLSIYSMLSIFYTTTGYNATTPFLEIILIAFGAGIYIGKFVW